MKKALTILILLTCTACARTSRDMWEDTKTCGRYMGKGLRSFLGGHVDGSDYAYYSNWSHEGEFVPLEEETGVAFMSDYVPISKESPGDPGCPIPGIAGFHDPGGRLAQLFANIHFNFDNFAIQGEENLKTLKEIADYLAKSPQTYIFIEGHADERGAAAYNLALGSRRANSVRTFLIQNGVNPDQLFTISYGKERPIAMGHDDNAHYQNRRAHFKLYDR
ncbi:MAG: OmpA family protein [Chlamydiales bacterium]|nr:OmpA family protein [Chlamydiales bacterium]